MDKIIVEICYVANNEELFFVTLKIKSNANVLEALGFSGIFDKFPEIDKNNLDVGVFAKKVTPDHILHNNDRIEVYRPLKISPMEARKIRVRKTS